MTDALYPTFAFLGFLLVLVPLPWHLQAWNAGTCLFMIWTAIGCLIHFINTIVWAGNLELHSAPWCDISTKIIVGLSVALPCASLCINRRLYSIARVSQVHFTRAEKRRIVYIDIAIGVGVPILVMALHYIVQGHRFDIFEDVGCWPSTVNMAPAYPLVWMWPVLIGLISMVYCVMSLNAFLRRRKEFNDLLATNQNLNINRYFRLMALATIEITTTVPFAVYFIYLDLTTEPISPWVSWSDTKWHFSRIDYIPAWFVNANPQLKLNFTLNLWLFPGCAVLFFAFFGFAEEARRNYKKLYYYLAKPFGITPPAYNQRTMPGRPSKVNITLPSTYTTSIDETSENGQKLDELSLKMPTFEEHAPTPLSNGPTAFNATTRSVSFGQPMPEINPTAASQNARPFSLASLDTAESSSFTSVAHSTPSSPTHAHTPRVPALSIARPDSEALSPNNADFATPHGPQASAPATRRLPSPATSRPTSYRQSTSTDLEISVSQGYLPHAETASRYHEEALLTRDAFNGALPSYPGQAHPHLHGGIRMTVEKSVV